MNNHTQINLVSSELSAIWKSYMFETLNRCVLQYFLATVEDTEIKQLIEEKLNEKEKRIQTVSSFFKQEGIPLPVGYTERDVDLNAPKLFNDILMAEYILFMAGIGSEHYLLGMQTSPRNDIRQYFKNNLTFFIEIQDKIIKVLLDKGIFTKTPFIPYPQQVDFVKDQSFLTGWLGDRRPLHAMQITHLFLNIKRNAVGKELLIGFSQTANSKEVREYMIRGKEITSKLIKIFSQTLEEDDITPTSFHGMAVTDSTAAPFSDKLMLSLIANTNSYAFSAYGLSLGESTRRDLFSKYTKIMTDIGKYGEDGINLLIKNGYLEEPPKTVDREKLSKSKNKDASASQSKL